MAAEYETDVEALRELYPFGDLEVREMRWRYHDDHIIKTEGRLVAPSRDVVDLPGVVKVFPDVDGYVAVGFVPQSNGS